MISSPGLSWLVVIGKVARLKENNQMVNLERDALFLRDTRQVKLLKSKLAGKRC